MAIGPGETPNQPLGSLRFSPARATPWAASATFVVCLLAAWRQDRPIEALALCLMFLAPGLVTLIRRALAPCYALRYILIAMLGPVATIPLLAYINRSGEEDMVGMLTAFVISLNAALFLGLAGHGIGVRLHRLILRRWPRLLVLMPIRAPLAGPSPGILPGREGRRGRSGETNGH
jgi:hypothetical protein